MAHNIVKFYKYMAAYIHVKLYNYEHASSLIMQRVIKSRWAGHVARMGKGRGVCRVLVGRLDGRRPLEKPRFR
jgi:hypothetical protein